MSEEEIPRKSWKGTWIPKSIWEHPTLSWMEKCLLSEIENLDQGNGCFASNKYLAEKFGSTEGSIANILSKFKAMELIFPRGFDGRKRRISCTHSDEPEVKAAFTLYLRQGSPTSEGRVHQAVNAQAPLIIDERKGEKKDERKDSSSAKASSPAASAGKEDNCPYQQIVEDYHQLCPSMPKLRGLSPKRRKAIREQWLEAKKTHPSAPAKQFCELFELAEKSDLLTGRDIPNREGEHKNWRADFEWLMNPNNAIKVLEKKYENRPRTQANPQNNLASENPPSIPAHKLTSIPNPTIDGKAAWEAKQLAKRQAQQLDLQNQ